MREFFGYIRVSTARQGEHGVSLQEQRDAIMRFGKAQGLEIAQWFEERETAAKKGRPVFGQMLQLLREGKAEGVVIHKIDRSTRNLRDWANLGDLIDQGIEVKFANESIDLNSRGGRLSADIQAVVAADYIRNLKEETRKGLYGRLKQGLYPMPAPLGYVDNGGGQPKTPCPVMGPLVKKAFQLYASGRYSLDTLREELHGLGLRNRNGGKVSRNCLSNLLNNPFYMGIVRLRRTDEAFAGAHAPLVSKSVFEAVQAVLSGKTNTASRRHDFLFRRLLACKHCGYSLIGETQKGHVYYRCHKKGCPTTSIRQEDVDTTVRQALEPLRFSLKESQYLQTEVLRLRTEWVGEREKQVKALKLSLAANEDRMKRLTDAFLDQAIDRGTFEERKKALLEERLGIEQKLVRLESNSGDVPDQLEKFLELAESAYLSYKKGIPAEKRDLLKTVTSNRFVDRKNVSIKLFLPFEMVANRPDFTDGRLHRGSCRKFLKRLIRALIQTPVNRHNLN